VPTRSVPTWPRRHQAFRSGPATAHRALDLAAAQASGELPLELSGQVGAGGTHQLVVVEHGAGAAGAAAPETAFRGHYLLTVTPRGGAEGVLLEPRPDVGPHE
jgi:hypothetical protein